MGKTQFKNETPKFYEMDGALRAYSNRNLVLAGIMSPVALISVAGFLFARMEPPTVIRIGTDGQASVITPLGGAKSHSLPSILTARSQGVAADEYEKQAFVKTFL